MLVLIFIPQLVLLRLSWPSASNGCPSIESSFVGSLPAGRVCCNVTYLCNNIVESTVVCVSGSLMGNETVTTTYRRSALLPLTTSLTRSDL